MENWLRVKLLEKTDFTEKVDFTRELPSKVKPAHFGMIYQV